jgi:hypothetical protein
MPISHASQATVGTILTNVNTIDGIVDTINTNVSNLAPAYGKVSVAPSLAAGKTVTAASGEGTWTLGAASSAILSATSNTIVGINISAISAIGTYQLNLYAASAICGSVVFSRVEVAVVDSLYIPFRSQPVTGAITAKLASGADDGEHVDVKLSYV